MAQQETLNPYAELGVEPTAKLEQITSSYRRLARVHHPDRNHGNEESATVAFQRLQHAYEMLSDPSQREKYDNHRSAHSSPSFPYNEDDYYDDDDESNRGHSFFGSRFGFSYGFPFPSHVPGGYARPSFRSTFRSSFDEWEREMAEQETAAAAKEAQYQERLRELKAEREDRNEAARLRREERKAAKEEDQAQALAEKDCRFRDETRVQEERWLEVNAVTKDEKLSTCLHSDHCSKVELRKKMKCGSCFSKRGTLYVYLLHALPASHSPICPVFYRSDSST